MNSVREILEQHGVRPSKKLGQSFLNDANTIQRIAALAQLSADDTVVEIGAGLGLMTEELAKKAGRVIALEIDRRLVDILRERFAGRANVEIVAGDVLAYDFSKASAKGMVKVVGNVPYNISTPIIAMAIEQRAMFTSLFMTVQYEFGARLIASPGSRDYSSLTCFVQMFAVPVMLFKISPMAFRPAPKIVSCFMRFDLREKPAAPVLDEAAFARVVRQAFQQRRKNILNSLASLCSKEQTAAVLEQAGVKPELRAGDLTISDYARIANAYTAQNLLS